MIFDRTQNDVDTARILRNEKVKFDPITMQPINLDELTPTELETLNKGTFNYTDLNRIENKAAELKALFDDIGYFAGSVNTKAWEHSQIFGIEDFERILANLDVLRRAYYIYKETPDIPRARYHFQNINDIEKILFDLETMYEDMKGYVRECGTFECGEENTI